MARNAQALVAEAKQKLKSGGFMSFLTGGPKFLEAQDLYQQAANQFKLSKEWQEAANCLIQCAFCASSAGSTSDEANFVMEAGNVLKKISTAQAVQQYERAVAIFQAGGRFQQSGKLLVSIAELTEAEMVKHKETMKYYKLAAEMFELDEHSKTSFSKCNLKVAEYSARDGDLHGAVEIFESEGEKALQNNILQYSAKDHFFRAGILHLVMGDSVGISLAVEKYSSLDPRFAGSREGALLSALAEALEGRDTDMFVDKLQEYDAVTPLDPWKTEFLVKVKDLIQGPGIGELDLS